VAPSRGLRESSAAPATPAFVETVFAPLTGWLNPTALLPDSALRQSNPLVASDGFASGVFPDSLSFNSSPTFAESGSRFAPTAAVAASPSFAASGSLVPTRRFLPSLELEGTVQLDADHAGVGSVGSSAEVPMLVGIATAVLAVLLIAGLIAWRRRRQAEILFHEPLEDGAEMAFTFEGVLTPEASSFQCGPWSHFSQVLTAEQGDDPFTQFE
jgi:hypothetical protein